jgi:RNA polymerase sigma factor (sigma-70 family)
MPVEDAEDRTHEVFLILVKAIQSGRVENPLAFPSYAVTVAKRQAIMHFRNAARMPSCLDGTIIDQPSTSPRDNPHATFEDAERNALMARVLFSLHPKQKEILNRFYVLEQSSEEICNAMALTETQFRLLKSRAKARFGAIGKRVLRTARLSNAREALDRMGSAKETR